MPEVPRQHPVEKDEIRLLLVDGEHGLVTVDRDNDVEALAIEIVAKHLRLRVLVLDDEHPRLRQRCRPIAMHLSPLYACNTV